MEPARSRARPLGALLAVMALVVVGCRGARPTVGSRPSPVTPGSLPVDTTLTVDGGVRYQAIDGFGSTVRLFDDPHLTNTFDPRTNRGAVVVPASQQAEILGRLYRDLGLTRMRPATEAGIEPVEGGPFTFAWKANDGYIDLGGQARPLGLQTTFLSPITLETWMTPERPDSYVDWAFTIIKRWSDQGHPLAYYSVVNEPGYARSGGWSGEYLRDVIKLLGPKLRAAGLKTQLVVPDDVNPHEALLRLRVVLADPDARRYVGALAYHLYDRQDGQDEIRQLGEQYHIPVWMTEWYQADPWQWADTMHSLLADSGVSAIDYLWGFFGQWNTGGEQLITILYDGANRYTGYQRTKQYYVFGQYSRFVRPGAQRVGATSTTAGVRVSAFTQNGSTVVVVVNDGAQGRDALLDLGLKLDGATASMTRTSPTEDWRALPTATLHQGRVVASLPASSVTTFVVTPPG